MKRSTKATLLAVCLSGVLEGLSLPQQGIALSSQTGDASHSKPQKKDTHACKGQNSCRGTGGCKSGNNGCLGKNSCHGKGGCATDGASSSAGKNAKGKKPEKPGQEGGTPGARHDPKENQ